MLQARIALVLNFLNFSVSFLFVCVGSEELISRGMGVPGLEFQCFTSRYNVVEVPYHPYLIVYGWYLFSRKYAKIVET